MSDPLTMMAVHAHPDDEAISTGGVFAKYAAEGIRTVLVTCTRGEEGEISDPALANRENLAEVRTRELDEACRILKIGALEFLGYRDSGMAGTPENENPTSFLQADLAEATGRLVALVRRYRPQVLITYDENGFYGHPDHIRANQITVGAFKKAGDPSQYPEQNLQPWRPAKLYYTTVPRSFFVGLGERLRELGIDDPRGQRDDIPMGVPDEEVNAIVDITGFVAAKHASLMAHKTQMDPSSFWTRMGPEIFKESFNREPFLRAESRVATAEREDDLFSGLR